MPSNPLNAYARTRKQTVSGREIEASVLEKAATQLRRCQQNWKDGQFDRELDDALKFNQKVWNIFDSDWQSPESQLPKETRENLLSLSLFVRKTTLAIMAEPKAERLNILIAINENLVNGLRGQVSGDVSETPESLRAQG